jgi:hypothetical protein
LELNPDAAAKEVTYDEETKTVRIPLAAVNEGQRRTKMVMFSCNQCGTLMPGPVLVRCKQSVCMHGPAFQNSVIKADVLTGSTSSSRGCSMLQYPMLCGRAPRRSGEVLQLPALLQQMATHYRLLPTILPPFRKNGVPLLLLLLGILQVAAQRA